MPVVPLARNLVDLPSPGVSARVEAPNVGTGGEMVGRALEGLGQNLNEASDAQQAVDTIHDHAAVKEATNHVLQWFTEAGYTGPDAFFQKDGRDAVEGQPRITKGLDTLIQEQRASLNNPRQQQMFDLAITPQKADWQVSIANHAAKQETAYDKDQTDAIVASTGELAKASYFHDPQGAEKQIDTGLAEIAMFGAKHGWSSDQTKLEQLKYSSGVYKDVGANLAYAGQDGPKLAQALVDQHGGSMTADDRFAVTTHARVAQNTLDAQARQAEAEMHRLATEAKHDARDRAMSAAANLDSGLPMDPKTYASALSDAQTAEDDGLVRRLQNGQLKNTTLFTHQKDTPVQLQGEINTLSAKISKDGSKANPNDIAQKEALQQLYGRVDNTLKTNGVAWAASTLGVDPGTLNINDPASVQKRVDLINTASRRAGQQLDPLQPSEVTPFTQTWRSGTQAEKTGLVMRMAQFGDLAPAAAQQIAPNDYGLMQLTHLAAHSNRSVAINRVAQAMAGYEAMKTEGDLVNKLASQSDFNTWVGNVLPGDARQGVFTVAKAMLAQDAVEHRWVDATNGPDDKAWYRAVNSALGAYNHGPTQLGGLAGYNGAQTVLPENMSLDDFEGRIARANDRQFISAGNGEPALGAGDLKKLHFIPVDDGVYRLESGGSFVKTKDGHDYTVDVRKLPHASATAAASPSFAEQLKAAGYVRY